MILLNKIIVSSNEKKLILGFKNIYAAQITLADVELVRMIKKGQLRKTRGVIRTPAEQFYALAT